MEIRDITSSRKIDLPLSADPAALPILDHWRIVESGAGLYLIEGTLGGAPVRETALALTLSCGGVAALRGRWVALGLPGNGLAIVDEDAVLNRAAAWIRAGRFA